MVKSKESNTINLNSIHKPSYIHTFAQTNLRIFLIKFENDKYNHLKQPNTITKYHTTDKDINKINNSF